MHSQASSLNSGITYTQCQLNKLKLKLLRASVVIAELVKEKNRLTAVVKAIVDHFGQSPGLDSSQHHRETCTPTGRPPPGPIPTPTPELGRHYKVATNQHESQDTNQDTNRDIPQDNLQKNNGMFE